MKNLMVRTHTFTMLTSRLAVIVLFAALLSAAPFHAKLAQNAPNLGAAASFAVLGGSAVTLTDSIVTGDVGVYPGTAVTNTRSTIIGTVHAGDAVAQKAYEDFLAAYTALAGEQCTEILTGTLDGVTLAPGVYCFAAAATLTGQLTLNGSSTDTWIFKIGTGGTGALTATDFSVIMPGGETCNNNVFWWVADAVTLTRSFFTGSILAGDSITVTGGSLDGQALAKVAVTLTDTDVAVCGTPPYYPSIKVTGGGQIPVPDPNSTGRATFGFNAQPDKSGGAKGNLNYVNHVTGLHVNGPVTSIQVIAIYPDGSPKTIRFSGTCGGTCSFSVMVEDHGEPGTIDKFGIRVTDAGGPTEVTSQRVISQGNIQFHK